MPVLPQFPLGSVLLPGMVLPLHVFEPRYREMIEQVLAGDRRFGVVLIERGPEVGGGDVRTMVGTSAEIVDADRLGDGRLHLLVLGRERFKVVEWLADDPYPKAEIELWPDTSAVGSDPGLAEAVTVKFRRCMVLASEGGMDVGPVLKMLAESGRSASGLSSMQMAAAVPVSTMDKQALLGCPGELERLTMLDRLIVEAEELIKLHLQG